MFSEETFFYYDNVARVVWYEYSLRAPVEDPKENRKIYIIVVAASKRAINCIKQRNTQTENKIKQNKKQRNKNRFLPSFSRIYYLLLKLNDFV